MVEKDNISDLISVIVPIYNVREYCEKCIKSIIDQTYTNLEILLVDDGSTDGSGEICDRYAEQDGRVTVYHKENGGLSDARNYALDRMHGEFVSFVDGDDIIHPDMLEELYRILINTGCTISACKFCRDEKGLLSELQQDMTPQVVSKDTAVSIPEIPLTSACNKLYRREIFDDIRYPVSRLHEDEFVFHRIMWKCVNGIAVTSAGLYCYVDRGTSIMGSMSKKRIDDALDALRDRVEYSLQQNWDVTRALKERYLDYCIDTYFDIGNRVYGEYDDEWLNILRGAETDMLDRYHEVKIDRKYYVFSKDPEKYKRKYYNRPEGIISSYKRRIINRVKRLFNKGQLV